MKRVAGYTAIFVLGFAACAFLLRGALRGAGGPGGAPVLSQARSVGTLPGPTDRYTVADAVARVESAVVNIEIASGGGGGQSWLRRFLFPNQQPPATPDMRGVASGVLISPDGLCITNYHVVADAEMIRATLSDGRELRGEVIGSDETSDLAVIRLAGRRLPHARLGNSDRLRVGEWVIAIGNPLGLGSTVTVGVVSARRDRPFEVQGRRFRDLLQTDAAINQGNSGGALVNLDGEVVGINTAIISTSFTGGNIGIGFAIPANVVQPIVNQLVAKGKVVRPWIGIGYTEVTAGLRERYKLKSDEGVVVELILPESPAARAGLRPGDLLRRVGRRRVRTSDDVGEELRGCRPGERLEVEVERGGRRITAAVTLGERPARLEP